MAFKIQQLGTGLFWASGGDRIRLTSEGSIYEIDSEGHIRDVNTGMYIRHHYYILMDASEVESPEGDFEWTIEDSGRIYNAYAGGQYVIPDGDSLRITPVGGAATSWGIVREIPTEVPAEPEEEDVPVPRASALIEEALNASASCGCECGCGPDCQGCECECGCPKAPVEDDEA
jgi:hypothetical protein